MVLGGDCHEGSGCFGAEIANCWRYPTSESGRKALSRFEHNGLATSQILVKVRRTSLVLQRGGFAPFPSLGFGEVFKASEQPDGMPAVDRYTLRIYRGSRFSPFERHSCIVK